MQLPAEKLTAEGFYLALAVYVGWIASLCLHEFGHAIVAYWGGDYSVKAKGYLSLNPLKYIHPILSIILPMLYLLLGGIGLPGGAVYINDAALRRLWWSSLVSLAGPCANLLVAIALSLPFQLGWITVDSFTIWSATPWWINAIAVLVHLQIIAALFNLLPVPGLDGYGILEPLLPRTWTWKLAPLKQYGIFIVLVVVTIPAVSWSLITSSGFLLDRLSIPHELLYQGYQQFRGAATLLGLGVLVLFFIAWKTNFFTKLRNWQEQQMDRTMFRSISHRLENQLGDRPGDRFKQQSTPASRNPVAKHNLQNNDRPQASRPPESSAFQDKVVTFPTPTLVLPPLDRHAPLPKQDCYNQLVTLLKQRKTQTAIEQLNQFATHYPQDADLTQWEAIVLFHHGCWKMREFQFASAQRHFDRALELTPGDRTLQAEIKRAKTTIKGMS
ncbi:MAG: site-2 protease family protein [Synechococcales bacterium]|nr:site-2 protease family protein [Synechococcales bacterium]